jgi:hypothetical protein
MKLLVLVSPSNPQVSEVTTALSTAVKAQGHTPVLLSPDDQANLSETVKRVDAIVADVSVPSTVIGHTISLALQASKPVVLLTESQVEADFYAHLEETSEKVLVLKYSGLGELKRELGYALEFVASAQDVRFNFFISADQVHYLDWIAKTRKLPRSVFLRQLIDADMVLQKEYVE